MLVSAFVAAYGVGFLSMLVLYADLMKRHHAFGGPYRVAGIFNIDDVVAPNETRARLIHALELTMSRRTEVVQPTLRSRVML